jgi:hypothetical protein
MSIGHSRTQLVMLLAADFTWAGVILCDHSAMISANCAGVIKALPATESFKLNLLSAARCFLDMLPCRHCDFTFTALPSSAQAVGDLAAVGASKT